MGFESASSIIRDICINKTFENTMFEKALKIADNNNINIVPLMMLKPPFLTEKESAEDFINSLLYLERFGLKRIDIELPTVEIDTLTFELWKNGKYKPANLWTLVYILEKRQELHLKTPIYVSPMEYSVDSYDKAFSCNKCFDVFKQRILLYNEYQDSSVFNSILCECRTIIMVS